MRLNGYGLNELYHLNVIDVNCPKENIFAVILLQLSKARSSHHTRMTTAWATTWCEECFHKCDLQWSSNQYEYLSDVRNGTVFQQSAPCSDFPASKNTSRQCHYGFSFSLHFHCKHTDHCTRLRKQGLCILAGGIYLERATNLLYLGCDGEGSERTKACAGNLQNWGRPQYSMTEAIVQIQTTRLQ